MTTTEQQTPDTRHYQEAIVAAELRLHGNMSLKRSDELATHIVAALRGLGWLRTSAPRSDDQ